jgi:hypothetical protein
MQTKKMNTEEKGYEMYWSVLMYCLHMTGNYSAYELIQDRSKHFDVSLFVLPMGTLWERGDKWSNIRKIVAAL